MVQHRTSKKWYAYFEWGRTGAAKPSFQFVACDTEDDAQREFASQLHSKNDRRGEWVTIAGLNTLRARAGQDCYLVRPMATRSTGLPDARSIKINEGAKASAIKPAAAAEKAEAGGKGKKAAAKTKAKPAAPKVDEHTRRLLGDLMVATVAYTRGSMADASLPTQVAIDEARLILGEAQTRLIKVGDDAAKQVKDKELLQFTSLMYSRIPKKKVLRAEAKEWILSKDNILAWQNDLDAFESALYATDIDHGAEVEVDLLAELDLKMEWLPPDSKLGKCLYDWWPTATANRHAHIGDMTIKNMWQIDRHADEGKLPAMQDEVLKGKPKVSEKPLHQPKSRLDTSKAEVKKFQNSNTVAALSRHAIGERPRHHERGPAAAEAIGGRRHHGGDVRARPVFRRRLEEIGRLHQPEQLVLEPRQRGGGRAGGVHVRRRRDPRPAVCRPAGPRLHGPARQASQRLWQGRPLRRAEQRVHRVRLAAAPAAVFDRVYGGVVGGVAPAWLVIGP